MKNYQKGILILAVAAVGWLTGPLVPWVWLSYIPGVSWISEHPPWGHVVLVALIFLTLAVAIYFIVIAKDKEVTK